METFTIPLEEDPIVFAIYEFTLADGKFPTREEVLEKTTCLTGTDFHNAIDRMLERSYRIKSGWEKIGTKISPTIELTADGRIRGKFLHELYLQTQPNIEKILRFVKQYTSESQFVPDSVLEKTFPDYHASILWHMGYLIRAGRKTGEIDPVSYNEETEFGYIIS